MNQRIRKAGGKVFLNNKIATFYYPRETIKDHWKIYYIWGKARATFFLKHKKLTSFRQLVPPVFVLAIIILVIFSFLDKIFLIFLIVLVGIYMAIDFSISSYLSIVRKKRMQLLPLLMIAFPSMHFGWGIGFLRGLFGHLKHKKYWR